MEPYLNKVTAFITRKIDHRVDLLLFIHPNAGIQIPAGTVEENEPLEQAALREAWEETGLSNLSIIRQVGWRDELPPGSTHVIFKRTKVYSRPNPTSFDWAEFPRGIAVRMERREGEYIQVTYEEGDQYPDPVYRSYGITGWVPEAALAATNRRHFFHLACTTATPERWEQAADKHTFTLFWAPLDDLPEIVPPQKAWLDYVQQGFKYTFGNHQSRAL